MTFEAPSADLVSLAVGLLVALVVVYLALRIDRRVRALHRARADEAREREEFAAQWEITERKLVRDVQQSLRKVGCDPGPVDGVDGPLTQDAIRQFQLLYGLEPDGILGPKTSRVLGAAVQTANLAWGAEPEPEPEPEPSPEETAQTRSDLVRLLEELDTD